MLTLGPWFADLMLRLKELEAWSSDFNVRCCLLFLLKVRYEGSSNLTQNVHEQRCDSLLFLHSHFMGWDKCVYVGGEYIKKTVKYETGKTAYWHAVIKIPSQISDTSVIYCFNV
jgi:hypothetical protein